MIDPWIELAGWVVAQAIEDACGGGGATFGQRMSAWRFLKKDPLVDHILDCFNCGFKFDIKDKREYILKVVIPEKKSKMISSIKPKELPPQPLVEVIL
jgi:NAD-dependent dihydropyrimidine dehydrogenase PreA subunit